MVLLMVCLPISATGLLAQGVSAQNNRRVYRVSLIQVIANPTEYDGQRLRIVGYLGNNGIDKAVGVFVSETDGHNFVLSNSVDLHVGEAEAKPLVGKYVVFSGTYHAPSPRSGSNGYIDQILDLAPWNMRDGAKQAPR
jgi:hypothetical protein